MLSKNKGVQAVLDAVVDFLPSPVDVPAIKGIDDDENEIERHADDKEPFSALAFKITTDPFVGTLTFIRVYSGVVESGKTAYNSVKKQRERLGRIVQMHSNKREEVKYEQVTSQPLSALKMLLLVKHYVIRTIKLFLSVWNSQIQLFRSL